MIGFTLERQFYFRVTKRRWKCLSIRMYKFGWLVVTVCNRDTAKLLPYLVGGVAFKGREFALKRMDNILRDMEEEDVGTRHK